MVTPLEPPRWARSSEQALRIAVVAFCAGASVPLVSCLPLAWAAFAMSPVAPWVTMITTGLFAYWVVRLSPRRSWRGLAVVGMSVAGGALDGLVAGILSGVLSSRPDSAVVMAIYGAMFGVG